jgi:hypothetical protein
MNGSDVREVASRNRWWIALAVVVVFGYSVGKDIAMRDNAADAIASWERQ